MHPLIFSTLGTVITFLLDIRNNCRQPIYKYIAIFSIMTSIGYFFQAMKAHAYEPFTMTVQAKPPSKSKREIQKEFIETCSRKANYHYEEGCKCLKQAEEVSLLFPDIDGFDKSQLCLLNIIQALSCGDPTIRVINIAITIAGQYAMLVANEYNRFTSLLTESKSHFEMEEHYRLVGKYQLDIYNAEKSELGKKKK